MLLGASPANVAFYRNVIRRVRDHQSDTIPIQQRFIGGCGESVAAVDAVSPRPPQVAEAGDGLLVGRHERGKVVVGTVDDILKNDVDFRGFEAKGRKVEIDVQISKNLELAP